MSWTIPSGLTVTQFSVGLAEGPGETKKQGKVHSRTFSFAESLNPWGPNTSAISMAEIYCPYEFGMPGYNLIR